MGPLLDAEVLEEADLEHYVDRLNQVLKWQDRYRNRVTRAERYEREALDLLEEVVQAEQTVAEAREVRHPQMVDELGGVNFRFDQLRSRTESEEPLAPIADHIARATASFERLTEHATTIEEADTLDAVADAHRRFLWRVDHFERRIELASDALTALEAE